MVSKGAACRTFLPPKADDRQLGTQIDLIVARGHMTDTVSKQATAFDAPFVPGTGCRHRPVTVSLPMPRRPHHEPREHRLNSHQVQKQLGQPGFASVLRQVATTCIAHMELHQSLDEVLLQGWAQAGQLTAQAGGHADATEAIGHEGPLTSRVQHMWTIRDRLRNMGQDLHLWRRDGPGAGRVLQARLLAVQLQKHTRVLRQACRRRKTAIVADVVNSSNIYQAAKRFGPKAPRRRLQLRRDDGGLQTHEEEFLQIKDYFTALYHAPRMLTQPALRQDLDISTEEIKMALHRIQPSKALSQNRRGNGEELAAIAAANLAVEVAAVVSRGQSAQSP